MAEWPDFKWKNTHERIITTVASFFNLAEGYKNISGK